MIGPTFRNIKRLIFLSFKLGRNISTINCFKRSYLQLVKMKDFDY